MSDQRDYLLDTTMLSYIAAAKCKCGLDKNKVQNVRNRIQAIQGTGRRMYISAITIGESEYGLRIATKADPIQQAEARSVINAFLPGLILSIDTAIAREHYSNLRASLFEKFAPRDTRGLAKSNFIGEWIEPINQKALGIQENDIWIASVAMAYNLTLVSSDKMVRIRDVAGGTLSYENWLV